MTSGRRVAAFLAVFAVVLLAPASASAHPLGNFTVNRYAGILVADGELRIDYVVDMAEIPTVQLRPKIDADGDGAVTAAEGAAWAARSANDLLPQLRLAIDGRPVELEVRSASMRLDPGQGGLEVLRLDAVFAAEAPEQGCITFADHNFEDRVGWREITVAGDGVAIEGSSAPAESVTHGLRSYPDDLLSSPLDVLEATASYEPGAGVPAESTDGTFTSAARTAEGGALVGLVGRTGPFMLLALALAFGFGAVHALGPGHGKTLMAAYLVGSGGRFGHAVAVGTSVALMHTASVLTLGFLVLSTTEVFAPERVYPWLGIVSGLIAFGLGTWLLVSRLSRWSERPHGHDHAAPHAHPHPPGHAHPPDPASSGRVLSKRRLAALATAGGILPSPSALVVLLSSVAAHRVGYGMALIGSFSLGLAGALVAVGVLSIRARDVISVRVSGRVARIVPVASAAAVAVLGLVLAGGGAARL